MPAKKSPKKKRAAIPLPPASDWRTSDQDEILRRTQRAIDEKHSVRNLDPAHPVFSNFGVVSPSGMVYQVEVRDLTGTPIENRIDELYSIVDFLDPTLLGPLFRFNRDFYQFDEKGRPADYQNLAALRERVRPILLRRRKHHVETELPDRTDRNHFVKLTAAMQADYDEVKR